MKWEVLVGDMSRNGKFYNFSRNKGFNRPAAQVDHWGTCREMGSASGRHVAKWEVLVGDMKWEVLVGDMSGTHARSRLGPARGRETGSPCKRNVAK